MALFGRKRASEADYTIDDLIVLERYEEAASRLKTHLEKNKKDIRHRVRYAEVLTHLGKRDAAMDEYTYAADTYQRDGFFDKAESLYSQALRLNPTDEKLRMKIELTKELREIDRKREVAVKALRSSDPGSANSANAAIELEQVWSGLRKTEIVRFLPSKLLELYLSNVDILKLEEGQELVQAGEELPELFVLVNGRIDAWIYRNGQPFTIRSFGGGDIIGERALFEQRPWATGYRVRETCRVLRLTRDGLTRSLQGNPDPRRLLDGLRRQGNDGDVALKVAKIH